MTISAKQIHEYRSALSAAKTEDERDLIYRSVYHLAHAGEQNVTTVGMSTAEIAQSVTRVLLSIA
jgi:hypothetical protein